MNNGTATRGDFNSQRDNLPGAGEWGSEPLYSRGDDYAVREAAYRAADIVDAVKGWHNAAANLRHYLDNSGDTLAIDPDRIAGDASQFSGHLAGQARGAAEATARQAIADGRYNCPIPFATGWSGITIQQSWSEDWWFALGSVVTAATGVVTVYQGDPPEVEVSYRSHLYDRYNWDQGKSTKIGPFTVTDEQLAALHRAGVAKEYDVEGTSQVHTYRCALGAPCPSTIVPDPAPGGR